MSTAVDSVFCVETYDEVADAYVRGLERRLDDHRPLKGISAVAWLPVAPLDQCINAMLDEGSPLRGAVAVAIAIARQL